MLKDSNPTKSKKNKKIIFYLQSLSTINLETKMKKKNKYTNKNP